VAAPTARQRSATAAPAARAPQPPTVADDDLPF
jgi:hypothetical protein